MKEWFVKYWAEAACAALLAAFTAMWKRSQATRSGMRALLRYEIIQAYGECDRQGYCPVLVLDSVSDMLTQYEALKGNHGVRALFEKMCDMPSEPKE
ncbi:MAG TPA: hypothetical protein P5075_07605 [Eubacteriales bacterium]|nr:hypothetical protein [Eubacteriales bacterium]